MVRTPVICERVRAQISLALDGELSQLEQAMVTSHVERCADCRAYGLEVAEFTTLLREAPLERMTVPVDIRRPRRSYAGRLQAGVAAAAAVVALGLATQLSQQHPAGVESPAFKHIRYPTLGQIQREQALLRHVLAGKRIVLDGIVI